MPAVNGRWGECCGRCQDKPARRFRAMRNPISPCGYSYKGKADRTISMLTAQLHNFRYICFGGAPDHPIQSRMSPAWTGSGQPPLPALLVDRGLRCVAASLHYGISLRGNCQLPRSASQNVVDRWGKGRTGLGSGTIRSRKMVLR